MSTVYYLFALLCATVTAQYDDLSILEEVLERTTLPTVEIQPEVTVVAGTAPSSTTGTTVSEVTTTTPERINHTTAAINVEISRSKKPDENIVPLISTPVVEPSPSSTTGLPTTSPTRVKSSAKPKPENSTTEKNSPEDKAEIPPVEKETILGLKPDLSRIYRRLFPYRNI